MNKSELVASVAEAAELTKKDAEKAVNAVFASVQKALVEDDKVQIIGLVQLAKVAILRLAKLSTFQNPKTQYSKLVKL